MNFIRILSIRMRFGVFAFLMIEHFSRSENSSHTFVSCFVLIWDIAHHVQWTLSNDSHSIAMNIQESTISLGDSVVYLFVDISFSFSMLKCRFMVHRLILQCNPFWFWHRFIFISWTCLVIDSSTLRHQSSDIIFICALEVHKWVKRFQMKKKYIMDDLEFLWDFHVFTTHSAKDGNYWLVNLLLLRWVFHPLIIFLLVNWIMCSRSSKSWSVQVWFVCNMDVEAIRAPIILLIHQQLFLTSNLCYISYQNTKIRWRYLNSDYWYESTPQGPIFWTLSIPPLYKIYALFLYKNEHKTMFDAHSV